MKPLTAWAPGRVELLGNHTDYNQGLVLSAAIHHGVTLRGQSNPGGQLSLRSDFAPQPIRVTLDDLPTLAPLNGDAAWANYPLGVIKLLAERMGPLKRGFDVRITSDLPVGAGLSSSAALEVATGKFILKLEDWELTRLELAKLCRRAENEFVGVQCGLLDQVSSIFGRRGHAVELDCRAESVENVPFPPGLALLVFHTGVAHRLVGGEYNERRLQCFEAAAAMGAPALRDVTSAQLDAARPRLQDILWRRAAHIVGENERVAAGADYLRKGDGAAFGQLMYASHESSRVNFENSTPELDALVELGRSEPGVLGSRLTGGGFGGATVSLVDAGRAEEIGERLTQRYLERTSHHGKAHVCEIADGAV